MTLVGKAQFPQSSSTTTTTATTTATATATTTTGAPTATGTPAADPAAATAGASVVVVGEALRLVAGEEHLDQPPSFVLRQHAQSGQEPTVRMSRDGSE